MLGATIVSIPAIVITTLSDWVNFIPTGCLQIFVTIAFNTTNQCEHIDKKSRYDGK